MCLLIHMLKFDLNRLENVAYVANLYLHCLSKATRERLENLKKQRQGVQAEEKRALQATGTKDTPHEDPVPGAENWTIEEVHKGIEEFQALFDKVENLKDMYLHKAQVQYRAFCYPNW